MLRCSRTCQGQDPRRCGGFLRSPPHCSWLLGPSGAGLPLGPLTRGRAIQVRANKFLLIIRSGVELYVELTLRE